MTSSSTGGAERDPIALSVLAIVEDPPTREVLAKVLVSDRLRVASDLSDGLELARTEAPDVAFVDVTLGGGAGLAMVHHLRAIAPDASVFALSTAEALEIAANAVALGGAGLLLVPLGGDEVLNAVATVRQRLADKQLREQLEQSARLHERAAGWIARVADLADATERGNAARQLGEILVEVTGAKGVAVYVAASEGAAELARASTTPDLEDAPAFGTEMDMVGYARERQLLVVPMSLRKHVVGHVLLREPGEQPRGAGIDGLLRLLTAQAATSFALLGERDRASGGSIKDPASSAYSFAYYVDVAGREIDKARRHGRRFAIATVSREPTDDADKAAATPAAIADHLLKSVRDTDIVARVDEHEFHVLLPETDGLGAHACRRRILGRLGPGERRGPAEGRDLCVGVATFPHDGHDLGQLLRMARRRADASKASLAHRIGPDVGLADLLDVLEWEVHSLGPDLVTTPRAVDIDLADAGDLVGCVVADALRGGAALVVVTHHPTLGLAPAVRAAAASAKEGVVVHALDIRSLPHCDDLEALAVIAEHGCYGLIGRSQAGTLRGVHAADPVLVDALADRMGRAAGVRVFG